MSEQSSSGSFRVFCAYPQYCGAETFVESEDDAEAAVDAHEEHHPTHAADYEWSIETATDREEGDG